MRKTAKRWVAVAAVLAASTGCAGSGSTVFLHPEFNFAYIERVAVVPFENLTKDQGAAARVTRLFVSELFATEAFEVVEPGEVSRALEKQGAVRLGELSRDQIKELAGQLRVQGIILGSVGESGGEAVRTGRVCTLVVRMVETDEGTTVWSATTTTDGRGFWSGLLGTREASESEVTRRCVRRAIHTLVR